MTRLQRLGLRMLIGLLVVLPLALWAWSAMSVTLVCTLDESSSACTEPGSTLADISFLRLAVVPWVLAALGHQLDKRLAARQRRRF